MARHKETFKMRIPGYNVTITMEAVSPIGVKLLEFCEARGISPMKFTSKLRTDSLAKLRSLFTIECWEAGYTTREISEVLHRDISMVNNYKRSLAKASG